MKVYRRFTGLFGKVSHITDEHLLYVCELPAPIDIIRAEMISLFCRVLSRGTESLQLMLCAASDPKDTLRSWLDSVQSEIAAVVAQCPQAAELRGKSFSELCIYIRTAPITFKRMCRRFLLNRKDPYMSLADGSSTNSPKHDPYGIHQALHTCPLCNAPFDSAQAVAAHSAKIHGIRTAADVWCHGSACWGCGIEFGSRSRIVQHLSRRAPNRCLDAIRAHGLTVSFGS
jgi:hypothetical protein